MRKNILILSTILLVFTPVVAQKELWGTSGSGYGGIFKSDLNGANVQDVHFFDAINGMKPYGRLIVASNGKVYGTASEGGLYCSEFNEGGVLYEYDLIFDTYKVVAHLGSTQLAATNRPLAGVIEPVAGILYGSSENGAIFKYTIATETISIGITVPSFPSSGGIIITNSIRGELLKASDGFVYGTTKHYSNNPNGAPYLGSIARLNTTNNNLSLIYPFELVTGPLYGPNGGLVEAVQGKLYGTTRLGGVGTYNPADSFNLGGGTLFEYTIATNTLIKKADFDYYTTGSGPGPLCLVGGKLYGILTSGGLGGDPFDPNQHYGSLFEYDIANDAVSILKNFGYENGTNVGVGANGTLLKGSDNNLYGISAVGIFKYVPTTDIFTQFTTFGSSTLFSSSVGELLEICRKPTYHFFDINAYTICVNEPFTFDVENTNATSYLWKKDGNILPEQNTGTLNLSSVALTDSGIYTCEMVNECGTTVTMPLQLTADACLGIDEAIGFKNAIKLYPNPANTFLNINLPEIQKFSIEQISITNMLGQTVYQINTNDTSIDISALSNGIYLLITKTDKGDWSGKFVKE